MLIFLSTWIWIQRVILYGSNMDPDPETQTTELFFPDYLDHVGMKFVSGLIILVQLGPKV